MQCWPRSLRFQFEAASSVRVCVGGGTCGLSGPRQVHHVVYNPTPLPVSYGRAKEALFRFATFRRKFRMREGYLHGGRGSFLFIADAPSPHGAQYSPTRHVTPFPIPPPTLPGSRDRSTLGGAHVGGAGGLPLRGDRRMGCAEGRTGQHGGKTKRKATVSGVPGHRWTFPACCLCFAFWERGEGG